MICIYCWKSRINLIFWIRNSKFSSKILLKTWNGKSFSSQYSYFWNLDFMILLTWIHRIIYISWQFWKFMYEAPRISTVRSTSTFVKQLLANSQFNISFWMVLCCWEQMMIEFPTPPTPLPPPILEHFCPFFIMFAQMSSPFAQMESLLPWIPPSTPVLYSIVTWSWGIFVQKELQGSWTLHYPTRLGKRYHKLF